MPKKISPNEMRQWLERYDSGESEAAIAKAVHRDVRTVKKQIARARREREFHGARVELLKNALKQHQDRLLNAIREVGSALVIPSNNLWRPWRQNTSFSPLTFTGSTATYEAGKGWVMTLGASHKPEWGLVEEHLKDDPMLASMVTWRRALAVYVEARVDLETRSADLIMEKTGYKLLERPAEPPFLYSDTALKLIYREVVDRVLGVEPETKLEDTIRVDLERGEVKYDAATTLAKAPGEEEKCQANILASLEELLSSGEAAKVNQTHKELEEATTKAKRAVEEILLLELIPGDCRVCRRLGI